MKPISCSWPVQFSDFKIDEDQKRFSRGKLAVFYKGETPDHRYFSDDFADQVIKTLPYAPIVSHYDAEKDDFVGHATEQDIYGIVDPCVEPTFEVREDGNTWAICETVYYTERPDQIGDIAKKIEGHSQSLELDPKTVKYVINYDDKKHFKNVEFTAGSIIGVSVLGKEQKPAFTGSAFFNYNETFEEKMKLLKEYCESKSVQNIGGNQMNLQEFMTLSWGEIASKVEQAIFNEYGQEYYTYIVDLYDGNAVFRAYSYIDGSSHLFQINYSLADNAITLGDIVEVHVTYEPIEKNEAQGDKNAPFTENNNESEEQPVEEPTEVTPEATTEDLTQAEEIVEEEPVDTTDPTEVVEPSEGEENSFSEEQPTETTVSENAAESSTDAEPAANDFSADDTQTQKVGAEDENYQETSSSSATLAESERAEFEALKREKKVNLINSFKDSLSDDEFNKFMENVDSTDYDALNVELLETYKRKNEGKPSPRRVFAFTPKNNASKDSELYSYIKGLLQ